MQSWQPCRGLLHSLSPLPWPHRAFRVGGTRPILHLHLTAISSSPSPRRKRRYSCRIGNRSCRAIHTHSCSRVTKKGTYVRSFAPHSSRARLPLHIMSPTVGLLLYPTHRLRDLQAVVRPVGGLQAMSAIPLVSRASSCTLDEITGRSAFSRHRPIHFPHRAVFQRWTRREAVRRG